MSIQNKNILVLLFVILLVSCSSTEKRPGSNDFLSDSIIDQITSPDALVASGNFNEAAKQYIHLASNSPYPERHTLQLKGIHLYIKDESFDTADRLLNAIDPLELNADQLTHYAYLNAHMSLVLRDSQESLQWLARFEHGRYLNFTSEVDALKLMAAIYDLANEYQLATFARIKLGTLISSDEAQTLANQKAIMHGMWRFSPEELTQANNTAQSPDALMWIELTQLVQKSKNPFRLGTQLLSWKALNPNNSVRDEIIAALAPQKDDEQLKIENIAVLLPQTGPFKKPAAAVRDGFLAGYYAHSSAEIRPSIRFYDSNSPQDELLITYQRAINEGADIVVGPLQKKSVEALVMASADLEVPMLALNQTENTDFYVENFYQFALSPGFEAKQTARRAWQDGHNNVAIIFPDNTWGNRVVKAFKEEWERLGGTLVSESSYEAKKNDFSQPLKALLAINESNARKKSLSRLLGTKLNFEPRRRQDIDFIFMASFPRQARLIPPQLKFFHAGSLPIYATSHSFSGRIDRKKDGDLNRLIIGDMPWTLTSEKNNNTKQQIYRIWPNESKRYNRLYAFGNDAYRVLNYLSWLRSNSESRLDGATGKLHMSETNQILRELTWAKFKNGTPRLLPATARLED